MSALPHAAPELLPDRFYQSLLDHLTDGVYVVDTNRTITYWSKGAERISGYAAGEVIGHSCRDGILVHTDAMGKYLCDHLCPLLGTFADRALHEADVFLKHRMGHRVPVCVRSAPVADENGALAGGVEVFNENGAKLAAIERANEMERLALIDPLTQVGNRRYAENVLREHDERYRRDGEAYTVLFLDLDHFKAVNDRFGHDAGDAVLRAVSRTITSSLRPFDFLGRWGGEEFLAVLEIADSQSAATAAARCCGLVRRCSIPWAGEQIRPTVSIGVAVAHDGESLEALIKRADERVYAAKSGGRDRYLGP